MNVTGIIAEYNPFHNGHAYLIRMAKEALGADYVVVAMSGNFVQRGEPAIFDKFVRTKMALLNGADVVLEIPAAFATASAQDFASAGVALLDHTGIVDHLLFGVEDALTVSSGSSLPASPVNRKAVSCDQKETALLKRAAELFSAEHAGSGDAKAALYRDRLQASLKEGKSYPFAQETALRSCGFSKEEVAFLSSSNNILAAAYLEALDRRKSAIRAAAVSRLGDSYKADTVCDRAFASAAAIRRLLSEKESPDRIFPYIPENLQNLYEPLLSDPSACVQPDDLSVPLQLCLQSMSERGADFSVYSGVSKELSQRLSATAAKIMSYSARVEALWTKQYTRGRVSRALLHIFLGITDEAVQSLKERDEVPYLRLLGFSEKGRGLLPSLKRSSSVPVLANAFDARDILKEEIRIANLYYALKADSKSPVRNELESPIMIV